MIPRLNITFSLKNQKAFWFGKAYAPANEEYLLNYARSGIVMALRAALPKGGRVGVVAYNCHTVANAVVESGCKPVFVDVTEYLHIDLQHLAGLQLNAIIVTNLFGIHNDIAAIRAAQPNAIIIVDNAHGYGLPAEGDFTVYSINQGKFPALGEGGILYVHNPAYAESIRTQYASLKGYSITQETKLYLTMLLKAMMHTSWMYRALTLRMKQKRTSVACRSKVVLKRMAKGVSRMYQQVLPSIDNQIALQKTNAQAIAEALVAKNLADRVWCGDNAFMAIARTKDTIGISKYLAAHGVESATHFARAIEWAKEFGYIQCTCPMTEQLTRELVMIPTYKKIKL